MKKTMEAFGHSCLGIICLVAVLLIGLAVIQQLWIWFILPCFGLAVPSQAMIYGLLLTIGTIHASSYDEKKVMDFLDRGARDDNSDFIRLLRGNLRARRYATFAFKTLSFLIALGLGWCAVTWFM